MARFYRSAALLMSLTFAGCSTPTQPLPSPGSPSGQDVPRAVPQPIGSLGRTEGDRSQTREVTGAFRHDDFVITVHGVRLGPQMFVQATYDLDPESQWPLNWPVGM